MLCHSSGDNNNDAESPYYCCNTRSRSNSVQNLARCHLPEFVGKDTLGLEIWGWVWFWTRNDRGVCGLGLGIWFGERMKDQGKKKEGGRAVPIFL
jgi:hypothetical protein